MAGQPSIKLYTDSTPNGIKISMALEELGLPYEVEHIDITTNRQKEPWFLEINPNGRIPAITDTIPDGQQVRVFEGGSILQYLTERYDPEHKLSFRKGTRDYWESWRQVFGLLVCCLNLRLTLNFNLGIGPMHGQAAHFYRYAPTKIQYGIDRYINETRRLYRVIDSELAKSKSGFLVADHISIADIAVLSWVIYAEFVSLDMNEFPFLQKWERMMSARPGINKGFHVPKPLMFKIREGDPEVFAQFTNERKDWILKGMEEAKKR
ncbi:glutathione S-transferase [Trichoderma guizhouense]|uniref:Glutathione S-transferase n=1 Tax=Trichoderma guizhouense TaxID=1491466 RepID=A0A1T3CVX7_9HYPO|nr:glutathione S-transferase [Trichoderma guizhouense]